MAKKQKVKKHAARPGPVGPAIMPMADRVLIKPDVAADETSPSGIIIPDSARKEKPERGTVIAVGEGKRNERGDLIPVHLKRGDVVIFSKYGYDEVKINDEEYYIMAESGILAIVKS